MDDQLKAIIDSAVADGLSDEDIDLIVREHQTRQTATPATGLAAMTPEQRRAHVLSGADLNLDKSAEQWQAVKDNPIGTALQLAIPGVLGVAGKYGPPLIKGAAASIGNFLSKPAGGAVVGAAEEGYRTHGDPQSMIAGAVIGGAASKVGGSSKLSQFLQRYGLGKPDKVVQGMSEAGDAAEHALANKRFDAILNKRRAANPAAWSDAPSPAPVAQAAQPATRQALESEIGKRIDWRITDAVPIDAIKRDVSRGGSIIEAGESQIGLAERLAQLMKNPSPVAIQEATELAKALRQRGHITRGMK